MPALYQLSYMYIGGLLILYIFVGGGGGEPEVIQPYTAFSQGSHPSYDTAWEEAVSRLFHVFLVTL